VGLFAIDLLPFVRLKVDFPARAAFQQLDRQPLGVREAFRNRLR